MSQQIDGGNFESEVAGRSGYVLADFWAPWCGYCRRLNPVLERLESAHGDNLRFAAVNVDDAPALAEMFNVDTIPTLILFQDGAVKAQTVNPASQGEIEQWLTDNGALK